MVTFEIFYNMRELTIKSWDVKILFYIISIPFFIIALLCIK